MRIGTGLLLALGAIVAIALAAASSTLRLPEDAAAGGEQVRSETVALAGAKTATVDIELGTGQLRLAGGSLAGAGTPMLSGELLRGEFAFDEELEPRIAYEVEGDGGHLTVAQDDGGTFAWPWDDRQNNWSLYLNPTVPTDLSVEVGTGESELSLGGLTLTGLKVVAGTGETTLDLAGDWRSNLVGEIESGAGELTVYLPRQVGVRLEVAHGVGAVDTDDLAEEADDVFVNDAYGTAAVTLDLRVAVGAGDLKLELVD